MGVFGSNYIRKSLQININEFTEKDFDPKFIREFRNDMLNKNDIFLESDEDFSEYLSLGLNVLKEASAFGKEVVKNKAELNSKIDGCAKELASSIKKNGLNRKTISGVMDKFWNKFAIIIDNIVLEDIFKKNQRFTAAKFI